ncbi:MAG: hypothetical protein WKF70_02495, partial [Chitinophagaceae bacterium]
MSRSLQLLLDWSEVWSLTIPLGILLSKPRQPYYLRPVIVYLCIALPLNLFGNFIADFKAHLPPSLQSNNALYNIHSIIRLLCFSWFFTLLKQPFYHTIKKALPIISITFILINFIFVEAFFFHDHLSGNLLSAEAFVLLIYCMLYYLSQLEQEDDQFSYKSHFWVATGLCIYVVVNFFVFLF